MPAMPPEHVSQYFTGSRMIYRILANGHLKEIRYIEGKRLVAVVNGEKLYAPDIAWCLHYGNWPKFPLVQLDGDIFNCSIDNLMPVRVKRLRFRGRQVGDRFYHNFEPKVAFRSLLDCRRNWTLHAREHYMKDLAYVLEVEASERELRRNSAPALPPLPLHAAARVERQKRREARIPVGARPPRPAAVPDMEWHWYANAWLSVPVACHVADDYRERVRRWLAGAVRFVYQPVYGQVWGFKADGSVVH